MANAIYPKWKEAVMAGTAGRDLDNNTAQDGIYACLVDTGTYTYSAAHEFFSSVQAAVVGSEVRIENPTVSGGVLDGDDVVLEAVSGDTAEAIVIFRKNSGAASTWPLFAFIDTNVSNLPITPNGGDITIEWNASGIVAL